MRRETRRAQTRAIQKKYKGAKNHVRAELVEVLKRDWPEAMSSQAALWKVFGSRGLLAQIYLEENGLRLSVRLTDGSDGLTWDDLAWVLHVLLPDRWAVEVYPPAHAVVNVANMRHLYVYPEHMRPPYDLRRR